MPDGTNFANRQITPPYSPPSYVAPNNPWSVILVDQYRVMLADPDGNLIGINGDRGAAGRLGRLVYAGRTPSNRGY